MSKRSFKYLLIGVVAMLALSIVCFLLFDRPMLQTTDPVERLYVTFHVGRRVQIVGCMLIGYILAKVNHVYPLKGEKNFWENLLTYVIAFGLAFYLGLTGVNWAVSDFFLQLGYAETISIFDVSVLRQFFVLRIIGGEPVFAFTMGYLTYYMTRFINRGA